MLNLPREQFKVIYKNTNLINYEHIFYSEANSYQDFRENYLPSKLWRLNNLYTIIRKSIINDSIKCIMNMNLSQHIAYAASLHHSRLIILKSRQQGVSTLWLVSFFDDCIFNNNFSSGLMAQGKEEAETLLDKTKLLWDNLDNDIKKFLNIDIKRNNTTEFSFTNDSTIFVRMSFRSTTLQRLHISEFGKIANKNPILAKETMTGTLQAISPGNTTIIESTAEGENRFKNIWERAELNSHNRTKKDFKPVFLSWLQDPDCSEDVEQTVTPESEKYFNNVEKKLSIKLTSNQKNFWIAKYRELETKKGKSDVYQEYPTTSDEAFIASRDGTYYANLYYIHIRNKNREINNLYDPNLKIQVATDLGVNDLFTIIIFQTYTDGWRIIEDYKNHGFGIKHYCDYLDERIEKMGYTKNPLVLLPHDAWVRGLNTGITREEAFNNYNYTNTYVVDKTPDINNDIELVRQELKNTYIDPQASFTIDCILNYSKEADDKRDIWKNKPLHNIYSHGADALRLMYRGGDKYTTPRHSKKFSSYAI